ncbi:MAG: hypothetical protein D6706_14470 [Chloroflexi bacterium]|nr:MAG: hypothetical protein D6706_14470 [Chloroflexota bacterium]
MVVQLQSKLYSNTATLYLKRFFTQNGVAVVGPYKNKPPNRPDTSGPRWAAKPENIRGLEPGNRPKPLKPQAGILPVPAQGPFQTGPLF